MKRTKPNNQEKLLLALEAFSSESFLSINKKLLSYLGPNLTVYIGNLIDKMKYFLDKGLLGEDNSFFLTQADVAVQTGMSEYQLRKCKNKLKEIGVLTTSRRGIPPKEFYILHIDILVEEFLRNIPLVFKGSNLKKLKDSTFKNFRNNKENRYKENKYKENNIYLSDLKKSDDDCSNNTPSRDNKNGRLSIKERNKQYLPIVRKLSRVIRQAKNIKHTPAQLRSWANEVRQLVERNGISPDRINKALDWYEEHIGGEYVPVVESGKSLREKFIKLEEAMQRDEKGTRNPTSMGTRGVYTPSKDKYARALARRRRAKGA